MNERCSRWVPPKKMGRGECKDGFPVTTGCVLGGILAERVRCIDEEYCGKLYFEFGGKPPKIYEKENRK